MTGKATTTNLLLSDPNSPFSERSRPATAALNKDAALGAGAQLDFDSLSSLASLMDQFWMEDKSLQESLGLFPGYFSRDYSVDSIPHYRKKNFIPFPEILLKQFDQLQSKCFMGIFPEIHRVWLTIDHRLFLWDYENGTDFLSYEQSKQIIMSVALVKPKPGVFVDTVKHLLVLATPTEIRVLGLNTGSGGREDYLLVETQLAVASDHVGILNMVGTKTGRIFMCGNDGHIYELDYQAEEGWFTRKCRKLNRSSSRLAYFMPTFLKFSQEDPVVSLAYDGSRNLLFSLSDNNVIKVIFLETHGNGFRWICTFSNLYADFLKLCPQSILFKKEQFFITSIHAISESESRNYNLMAVTSSGIRLYFEVTPKDRATPNDCALIHVRLPYQTTGGGGGSGGGGSGAHLAAPLRPFGLGQLNLHTVYACRGALMAAHAASEEEDVVWQLDTNYTAVASGRPITSAAATASAAPAQTLERETHATFQLRGKTWAISEAIHPLTMEYSAASNTELATMQFYDRLAPLHEYIDEQMLPQRRFLILSHGGLLVLAKLRPIDILEQILLESSGQESEALRRFFCDMYSRDHACTIALTLATHVRAQKPSWTTSKSLSSPGKDTNARHPSLESWSTSALFRYSGEPGLSDRGTVSLSHVHEPLGRLVPKSEIQYSGKHNGILMYFIRAMRRLWKIPLHYMTNAKLKLMIGTLIQNAQDELYPLLAFMESHAAALMGSSDRYTIKEAQMKENANLTALQQMIRYVIESLSLVSMLMDHPMEELLKKLSLTMSKSFHEMNLSTLVSSQFGHDILCELIAVLIERHLEKEHQSEALIEILVQRCPLFFESGDLQFFKASEVLHRVRLVKNEAEKIELLRESIGLLGQIPNGLGLPRLSRVCEEYRQLFYHPAAIELCLGSMDKKYPENKPSMRSSEELDYLYHIVFSLLSDAYTLQTLPPSTDLVALVRNSGSFFQACLATALSSSRKSFHVKLYDWIAQQGWTDVLVKIKSSFIEAYLREHHTREIANPDILWKYYVANEKFDEATRVLLGLAENAKAARLGLRLEWLSLALANAKAASSKGLLDKEPELIQDLEEKLEIANLQCDVLKCLENQDAARYQKEIQLLHTKLYSLSDLYNQFTHPHGLWELSLRIIDCSQYSDQDLVVSLWHNIIQREMNQSRDPVSALAVLRLKIAEMGRQLLPSELAFPSEYLCQHLEKICYQYLLRVDPGWTIGTLRDASVSFPTILKALHGLFEARTVPWNQPSAQLFLLENLLRLLKQWLTEESENSPISNLRYLDETIARYIVALSRLDPSNRMIQEFSELQKFLRRQF